MQSSLSRFRVNDPSSKSQSTANSQKLIVFDIGKLTVAFCIEKVYKIVDRTPVHGSGLSHIGITHIDDSEIPVVDLHQRLLGSPQLDAPQAKGYLVIVQSDQSELLSIPTAHAPLLIEAPLSRIRVLPETYRRADTLEIASHVTIVSRAEKPSTIFVLDVNRLL